MNPIPFQDCFETLERPLRAGLTPTLFITDINPLYQLESKVLIVLTDLVNPLYE